MAELSTLDRRRIHKALQRYWSQDNTLMDFLDPNLLAAVNATDGWINDNQSSFNLALPAAFQSGATAEQKTLLLCAVALMRVDPGVAALLKRALGVEVG